MYDYTATISSDTREPKQKSTGINLLIKITKWKWKNRRWKDCRHKRKAYEKFLREV